VPVALVPVALVPVAVVPVAVVPVAVVPAAVVPAAVAAVAVAVAAAVEAPGNSPAPFAGRGFDYEAEVAGLRRFRPFVTRVPTSPRHRTTTGPSSARGALHFETAPTT
jgi:hypothetical protein